MASKEITEEVLAMLRKNVTSKEIAKKIGVSIQVVQGIKAHFTMGKYGDLIKSKEIIFISELSEKNDVTEKAKAIFNGYIHSKKIDIDNKEDLKQALFNFAKLMSQITSHDKNLREIAKIEIRQFSKVSIPNDGNEKKINLQNRWRKWTNQEISEITSLWTAPGSEKNLLTLEKFSKENNRSYFAMVIRLYQIGLITLFQGDDLCIAINAPQLLSEKFPHQSDKKIDGETEIGHEDTELELDLTLSTHSCLSCGQFIPSARMKASPYTNHCTKCQSNLEKRHDYHRYIDEGIAGTRESHKLLYGQDYFRK
jgi:Prokaryotic dksA/traR C4-type zinc finger